MMFIFDFWIFQELNIIIFEELGELDSCLLVGFFGSNFDFYFCLNYVVFNLGNFAWRKWEFVLCFKYLKNLYFREKKSCG